MWVPQNTDMDLNDVMCNWLVLETLGFRPIMPKNFPGLCERAAKRDKYPTSAEFAWWGLSEGNIDWCNNQQSLDLY